MRAKNNMGRRVLKGVLLGVALYVGIILWIDLDQFRSALRDLNPALVLAACGLSLLNYLIRFCKWHGYLRLLGIEVSAKLSFLIYMAGLSMGVTPGKMGEVLKSWMLRRVTGTPIHKSAPIVVAERYTDLLGYLILMAVGGIATVPGYQWLFWATLGLCGVGLVLAGSRRVSQAAIAMVSRAPWISRLAPKVEGSFESTRLLLTPRRVVLPTLLSVISWGCECTGFWLIADGLTTADFPFLYAVFAYAFSAVAGAVAIVFPGGLVITEGSLGTLTRRKIEEMSALPMEIARSKAAGATLLARLCTLWLSVALGLVATAIFQRRYGDIDPEGDDPARGG